MLHQKLMATLENDITAYIEDLLNQQSAKYNQEITLLKTVRIVKRRSFIVPVAIDLPSIF